MTTHPYKQPRRMRSPGHGVSPLSRVVTTHFEDPDAAAGMLDAAHAMRAEPDVLAAARVIADAVAGSRLFDNRWYRAAAAYELIAYSIQRHDAKLGEFYEAHYNDIEYGGMRIPVQMRVDPHAALYPQVVEILGADLEPADPV